MRRLATSFIVTACLIAASTDARAGSSTLRWTDLATFSETAPSGTNGPGTGGISGRACDASTSTQPAMFAGNVLLDCDSAGPHNETAIAVNPINPANIVAASHTYLYDLDKVNAIALLRIFTEAYVTTDGGRTWSNIHPPNGSYRFLTDPSLAFGADGVLYWSNVASHDSVAGAFSDVSVIVERSLDGGLHWTDPITVTKGNGTVSNGGSNVLFNDKDWIAADRGAASPYRGSVYVTWARQQIRKGVMTESPIFLSRSADGGQTWTDGAEISGSSALCSGQGTSGPRTRCDQNDAGFATPVVAPNGTIYVPFLNHQVSNDGANRDQVLLVSSADGGATWSDPVQVVALVHDGFGDYPTVNSHGEPALNGCEFRIFAAGNLSLSEAAANAGQLYYVYAENLDPGASARTNIMVTSSTDAGRSWSRPVAVHTSSADQIYPWSAVGTDGRLRVGYVDRGRATPSGAWPGETCVYGYTLASARDVSATRFTTQSLETGVSFASSSRFFRNLTGSNVFNARFIGDYTNIALDRDNHVWATWTDMRAPVDPFFAIDTGTNGPPVLHAEHAVAATR